MSTPHHSTSAALLVVFTASLGCNTVKQDRYEDDVRKQLPEGAELAVTGDTPQRGLVFQSPADGQALYFTGSQLVARFMVKRDDTVRLNSWRDIRDSQPWTVVTVNGEPVYESQMRSAPNRFYIVPE